MAVETHFCSCKSPCSTCGIPLFEGTQKTSKHRVKKTASLQPGSHLSRKTEAFRLVATGRNGKEKSNSFVNWTAQ